jgi:ribosomal protein S18 acetylase RimI-like enzyme
LTPHEFDTLVVGRLDFRAEGLIVAEDGVGRIVGFAHAGFGPIDPCGPDHDLDTQLGTVAMLVVAPEQGETLADDLFRAAEVSLRDRGASVIYAGGRSPLDPFYRGIYGGSEFSGVLDVHETFRRAASNAGYEAVAATVRFELDLAAGEARDPKAVLVRRQARVDVEDDAMPAGWWESIGLGPVEITRFRLLSKLDNRELARASTWDMSAFGRPDGRARTGLFAVEVPHDLRRKGYGRHLIAEILRHHRGQWGDIVAVQTDANNEPARAFYRALGFAPTGLSTLFRKPGGRPA